MSKSLARVCADAEAHGLSIAPIRMADGTTTAAMAAAAVGADVGQIVKSVVLRGVETQEHVLFLTAGDNQVDLRKASQAFEIELEKADAASIRAVTGFAIGGVSPLGHKTPLRVFFDPDLLKWPVIWAAAGTPHHVFQIAPQVLLEVTAATQAAFTQ